MTPDERESKLPAWAREELCSLRTKLASAQQALAALRDESPSQTELQLGMPHRRWLPDAGIVRFNFGTRTWIEVRRMREKPSSIAVMASHAISVFPAASNVVRVEVKP